MFWFLTDHENSRHRNHVAGAFYDFLSGFCLDSKIQYAGKMLVIYFKTNSAIFREQGFYLQVISTICED